MARSSSPTTRATSPVLPPSRCVDYGPGSLRPETLLCLTKTLSDQSAQHCTRQQPTLALTSVNWPLLRCSDAVLAPGPPLMAHHANPSTTGSGSNTRTARSRAIACGIMAGGSSPSIHGEPQFAGSDAHPSFTCKLDEIPLRLLTHWVIFAVGRHGADLDEGRLWGAGADRACPSLW